MILYICKIFNTPFTHFFKCKFYLFSQHFLARTDVDSDDDELKDAGKDEDHADEHPDIQEGNIGDPGYILSGLHKLWYPGIRDRSTWSKFGAHGEHGDVFLFSNLGAL